MTRGVTVVVVHYRSRGDVARLFADLAEQQGVTLDVVVVECGDDGSVPTGLPALGSVPYEVLRPGQNLGYTGGNNLAFTAIGQRRTRGDVLVVNPDVRLLAPDTVSLLHAALHGDDTVAAVGPAVLTPDGLLEHAGAVVDEDRSLAVHVRTGLAQWPADQDPDLFTVPWINGCCWLLRREALDSVGGLDDRFFLFFEEVEWALRAAEAGWTLGLVSRARVRHARSSSFGGSQKGSYYYWRNNYLLFRLHHSRRRWMLAWVRRLLRFAAAPRHLRTGASLQALHGGIDALRGRSGPQSWRREP